MNEDLIESEQQNILGTILDYYKDLEDAHERIIDLVIKNRLLNSTDKDMNDSIESYYAK